MKRIRKEIRYTNIKRIKKKFDYKRNQHHREKIKGRFALDLVDVS